MIVTDLGQAQTCGGFAVPLHVLASLGKVTAINTMLSNGVGPNE